MQADFPVLLDACVLANARLSDLLLRLAESPRLYLPRWSREILREVRRTHVEKLAWSEDQDTLIRLGISVPNFSTRVLVDMGDLTEDRKD